MLARRHRITHGDDYRHVVRRGARAGVRGLTVSVAARDDMHAPTRFGFIVSKRVGVAVVRNRLRRRLKHVSFELLPSLPHGLDIVYRAHPEAAAWDFEAVREHASAGVRSVVRRHAARSAAHAAAGTGGAS